MESGIVKHSGLQPVSVEQVVQHVKAIQEVMKAVMNQNRDSHGKIIEEHYGRIPGCGDKPTLFKSGAEKIANLYQLVADYEIFFTDLGNNHREYRVTAKILHSVTGQFVGSGVGVCSTMESKYRWRNASKKCPTCGKETIIKGKAEYGGGWICFAKKGGCGEKWLDGNQDVEGQPVGKVENPDIADQWNTVLKMATKRAYVAGIISATAASDLFTQDIEDLPEFARTPIVDAEYTREPGSDDVEDAEIVDNPSLKEELPLHEELEKWLKEETFIKAAPQIHKALQKNLSNGAWGKPGDTSKLHKRIMDWVGQNNFELVEV